MAFLSLCPHYHSWPCIVSCCVWFLGRLSGRDKGTSWCRKAGGGAKAKMAEILGDIVAKKATDGRRKFDAATGTSSNVGSAAALAVAKLSRPSSSSGPDVGVAG